MQQLISCTFSTCLQPWQGGWVQLEQSDIRLALNMAKMAKGGLSRTTIEETQFLIKEPRTEVQEWKKPGVEFPGHGNAKAAMDRHPAMLQENETDCCLPCQSGTAKNPQTCWRCKGTGAPPQERLREPTPEPTPHLPRTALVPPGDNEAAHVSEIAGLPPGYLYIHTCLPTAQFFNHDAYAKDRKRDKDFNPDLLTDKGTSTG